MSLIPCPGYEPEIVRPPVWPACDDDKLRKLAAEGHASGFIARRMHRTRNAVMGRAWRLGISLGPSPKEKAPKEKAPIVANRAWVPEAERLIAGGMTVRAASRAIGMSETTVRIGLDINGAREKANATNKLRKAAERARLRGEGPEYVSRQAKRFQNNDDRSEADAEPTPPPTLSKSISLPRISMPALEEGERRLRLVPKIAASTEKPGVERIRQIHLAMLRRGAFVAPDLMAEMRL